MPSPRIFQVTRWRLASLYTGVMGAILLLGSVGVHQLMVQAQWELLHQELQAVAGTLHDGLEPVLGAAGRLSPTVDHLLPGVCRTGQTCATATPQRHVLGIAHQDGYYVRFISPTGQLVGTLGPQPPGLAIQVTPNELWQTLPDRTGARYHHISLPLKNRDGAFWGYLQLGRSLAEFDRHLHHLTWMVGLGVPVALGLVGAASWWLAGVAMRPVEQSYRQMQQFTADAAHELRTPLAALRATVEAHPPTVPLSPGEQQNLLHALTRQSRRLSQLVQDLLLLSQLDGQRRPVTVTPCCLPDLVSDLVEELAPLAIAAQLTLQADIQVPAALTVRGQVDALYRLVTNLLTNAIHATPPGGEIVVRLTTDGATALLSVVDTGSGIAPAEQTRIFQRFYRVDRDRSRKTGGAGLGLAIAQAIAQQHRGSIHLTSTPGMGSCFTVRLPLTSAISS